MSQEERLLILQMVADKKITAAEGVELLRAIDAKEKPAMTPPTPPAAPAAPGAAAPSLPPLPDLPTAPELPGCEPAAASGAHCGSAPGSSATSSSGATLGSGLASFIEDIVDRVSSAFSEVVEPRYEFTYELTGEFTGEQVPLRIQTGNGRAEVKGWDEPGFKAVILVKARGNNEDDARNRARDAYTVKSGANGFELETRRTDWNDIAVHVTLYVPRTKRYSLDTRTGNGHVEVRDIVISEGRVTTGNGRVVCTGGGADRLTLRSGNGSVEISGDMGDVEAGTGNGSVTVRPTGVRSQSYRLNTGNGSVRVETNALAPEAGFRVEAHTGMGGVTIGMPNLVYERDIRTVGHKQIIAHTPNYDQAGVRVTVAARTGMGSISIG